MSIKHLPISTPPLSVLLHDLGTPHVRQWAAALDVGERTARRWMAEDQAPRPVMLSLFWVSTWGRQWLDVDQQNRLVQQMHIAQSLARELDQARAELAHLLHQDAQTQTAPRLPQAPRLLYSVR
jgi:hypothetical protein